ncbi:MAG TPA: hypothetical protein VGP25_11080 [Gemmatimonadaceae bacterium]|jgi:hypothetical protein|nr:hypothetical protein [Gemmatimonadaceae bacterium]
MRSLKRVAIACSTTLLLSGCAKSDAPKVDTAAAVAPAAAPAPPPAPAPLALADVAGKWVMVSTPDSKTDTVSTKVTLTATADTTGWSLTLPSGVKVPLHVVAAGDSIVSTSDVYASVRRKGQKVHTVSTLRLKNGELVGQTVAHYVVKTPDSVLVLNSVATKQK